MQHALCKAANFFCNKATECLACVHIISIFDGARFKFREFVHFSSSVSAFHAIFIEFINFSVNLMIFHGIYQRFMQMSWNLSKSWVFIMNDALPLRTLYNIRVFLYYTKCNLIDGLHFLGLSYNVQRDKLRGCERRKGPRIKKKKRKQKTLARKAITSAISMRDKAAVSNHWRVLISSSLWRHDHQR